MRLNNPPALVCVEAVDLVALSILLTCSLLSTQPTSISPPCVPAKMYCSDTASARIDLSCFMRCDSAGVRLSRGAPFAMLPLLLPLVLDMLLSWLGGPVIGIVS